MNVREHEERARGVIADFNLDESHFALPCENSTVMVSGNSNNKVLVRDDKCLAHIKVNFNEAENCRVFIGAGVRGVVAINVRCDGSTIYIGSDCHLRRLEIRSRQPGDFIAVGNGVTTTGKNVWISSKGGSEENPAIIIGDDCMFSSDIVIRNSDAHPIFNLQTDDILNAPRGSVVVEPHVWVAEQVSILKAVTIGACSIIALGSVVTRDVPRFSIAKGVPAVASRNEQLCWARTSSKLDMAMAKKFAHIWGS